MTDKEIQQRLKHFDAVWQRVQGSKARPTGGAALMPRKQPKSHAVRFNPEKR